MNDFGLENYLRDISRTPLLSAEMEKELARRLRKGDADARDRMIRANLRLVVAIAKGYIRRGLPYLDVIAEGNLGLIRAVERFDPEVGVRFASYGSWWIRRAISIAVIEKSRIVRIPTYIARILPKWRQAEAFLEAKLGRPPFPFEIARHLGIDDGQINTVLKALGANDAARCVLTTDNGLDLGEVLEDSRGHRPHESLARALERSSVGALLNLLGSREAEILRMRFGLNGHGIMTLEKLSAKLGLTRARVQQIEKQAIEKLRSCVVRQRHEHPL